MSNQPKFPSPEPILHKEAKEFIEYWHYSHKMPTSKNILFGWRVDVLHLYAVACYGIGVNPYQASFLSRLTGYDITNGALVELKRLCRVEPKIDKMPLTAFLSRCHKKLKADGIRYVVSFSDPEYGHDGGIYKAANFQHLGKTNAEFHLLDKDGVIHHRRLVQRYKERKGITIAEAREELGMVRHKVCPKDRWFLPLIQKGGTHDAD